MAKYAITCVVNVSSMQKAVAIREWMKKNLPEDADVERWDATKLSDEFEVMAVDTEKKKVFTKKVEATDGLDARQQVAADGVEVVKVGPVDSE